MDRVRFAKPFVPKIVLMSSSNESDIVSCINMSAYSILKAPVNFDDLRLSMIMALNQSKRADKIMLDKGVYYDAYRERFYNAEGHISLTKFEFQVLKLLLDNHNKIISYEEIKEKVWKEKKMSIFTMRNVINKIRNKTYYEIIRNSSSKGYQIDNIK
jgi:DNA-binding response OmpR family regulator